MPGKEKRGVKTVIMGVWKRIIAIKNTIILKKNLIFLAYMRKKQYLCSRKGFEHTDTLNNTHKH